MQPGIHSLGKILIGLGLMLALAGGLLLFVGKIPLLGRLPGDISFQKGAWSFHFPLGTSILLSLLLSFLLTLLFFVLGRR